MKRQVLVETKEVKVVAVAKTGFAVVSFNGGSVRLPKMEAIEVANRLTAN